MINTKDHFILKASTSSVPLKKGDYIFQIDTTAYFNSPILETGKVTSEGGLMSYTPKMALVADRVYYWRVNPDDATAWSASCEQQGSRHWPGRQAGNQGYWRTGIVESLTDSRAATQHP